MSSKAELVRTEDSTSPAGTAASDEALVARCRAGQTAAFESLIERHRRTVAAVVWRALGHAEDTEDVVQEAFVQAYHGLRRFRGSASFLTWVCAIALNLCRQHRRSAWKRRVVLTEREPADSSGGAGQVEGPVVLRDAVARLAPKYRLPLLLQYADGYTSREVGEMLRIPPGTVRTRVREACRRVRRALGEEPTRGAKR